MQKKINIITRIVYASIKLKNTSNDSKHASFDGLLLRNIYFNW